MTTTIEAVAGDIAAQAVDAIIVNLFEGVGSPSGATAAVDKQLGGAIADLVAGGDFTGKLEELAVLYPRGAIAARRVIVVGLGAQEQFTLDRARRATAAAVARARGLGAKTAATVLHGAGAGGFEQRLAARALAEGVVLGLYVYDAYRSRPEGKALQRVTIVEFEAGKLPAISSGAEQGAAIAECANFARDLVNEPPNACTPEYLAAKAQQIAAAFGLTCRIVEMPEMRALGMGALLSVTAGSDEPAKLIVLEYNPDAGKDAAPVAFVGKAITFDTGGYSLKTHESMAEMKADMAGGAAVLGALRAAAMLGVSRRVVGLVPASENMVSGCASRPSDIVKASNGKTIEIISTDAEGRMILADTLVYAARYNPAAVIDLATLTGAAMVALGRGGAAALFTPDDQLRGRILAASDLSGERAWPMPLYDEYAEWMRGSQVADLRNSPQDRYAGTGASAAFLREFAEGYPWAHLDIAPMAFLPKDKPVKPIGAAGATGYGVRLLSYLLLDWTY